MANNLVNIDKYEKRIRAVDTDEPNARNLVYRENAPGFYEVSPWLENGRINGLLIEDYNGYDDIAVGSNLDGGGTFTCTFEVPSTPPEADRVETFVFSTEEAEDYGGWNRLVGTVG